MAPLSELVFDDHSPESSALTIGLASYVETHGSAEDLVCEVSQVSGGITNLLYRASVKVQDATDRSFDVLIRRFGAEGMIDRQVETRVFQALAEAGIAPPFIGNFQNGRVEGFLPSARALAVKEMGDPTLSALIASELASVHAFEPPKGLFSSTEPSLQHQIYLWLDLAEKVTIPAHHIEQIPLLSLSNAREILNELFERIQRSDPSQQTDGVSGMDSVFSHNDLLCGNILLDSTEEPRIQLIDFEYGAYNFRAFDIANHFNEWAGGTDDAQPDYSLLPTIEQQTHFCQAYLSHVGSGSPEELQALLQDVAVFLEINHWYWGLWAIVQGGSEGTEAFDYFEYAKRRLEHFQAIR